MANLVISGDTSGSVTLAAPAVSGTTTLTLPTTTGTLIVNSGAQTIEFAAGTVSAPSITTTGDTNTGIYFPAADTIAFAEGGVEAMRIDSSGRLLINTTTARTTLTGDRSALVQIEGQSVDQFLSIIRNENNAFGSAVWLGKSRGTTAGSNTTVQAGDSLGSLVFLGANGTNTQQAATISVEATGTISASAMPGNMIFTTTGAGSNTPTERMRITSDGKLGVGKTPSAGTPQRFQIKQPDATYSGISIEKNNDDSYLGIGYWSTADAWIFQPTYQSTGSYLPLAFATSGTERMRIHSGGNITMGTSNASIEAGPGFKFIATTNAYVAMVVESSSNGQTNYHLYSTGAGAYRFYVGAGGTISATATTITAISDIRLKENIRDLEDGLNAVMALKPRKFDWKAGKGKDIKNDRGWIAQEFETVFPDMIEEWKDTPPEGEEPYKAVNANLIPTLVKAIQELNDKVEAQAAEIQALKGAK